MTTMCPRDYGRRMETRHGGRRWVARLAVWTILLQAVLPFVVLAAAPRADGPPLVICTVEGMKVIPAGYADGGGRADTPMGPSCPFCVLPVAAALPPPAPPLPLLALLPPDDTRPLLVEPRFGIQFFLVGRPARAPPGIG